MIFVQRPDCAGAGVLLALIFNKEWADIYMTIVFCETCGWANMEGLSLESHKKYLRL